MNFRDAAFESIGEIMRRDLDVVVMTNDMGALLLDQIKDEMPDRVINCGIAEQNMMSVSGGLAYAGKKVFVYGISAHITTRAVEQIKLDICAPGLPVTLVGVGVGLAYGNDGPTHHGIEDIAIMRALPNMAIYNPSDTVCAGVCVREAYFRAGPAYVRLDKERNPNIYAESSAEFGAGLRVLTPGSDLVIVSTGIMVHRALEVAARLRTRNVAVRVVDVYCLKPLISGVLRNAIAGAKTVMTVEESSEIGGLGTMVATLIAGDGLGVRHYSACLPDSFHFGSATRSWAHNRFGLTVDALESRARTLVLAMAA